ncbi:cell envelope integrity protein CreD [Rhodohalobacter mucosus]|uniref:Cell envelope integrity protein CreD n=1 Tax=Rhodohalobacter mucosus TaxID=2079485 RepID=A0A316TZQ3_9BACT|nr:cell envelope integrity protein CreD [Rhodohalobacter mucosus]PWN05696.1 cell envelope integrity protein CreD [Rhodohalobacter mucosus]
MKSLKQSAGIRLTAIAFLTLLLLIPAILIQELISERENRRNSVAHEISEKWGDTQTITGPIITIPYLHRSEKEGVVTQTVRHAHFLPENLTIQGTVEPEVRYRGIYESIVYTSGLSLSGNFSPLNLRGLNIPADDFLTEDAFVSIGISDMTGIRERIRIEWGDRDYTAAPGIASGDVLSSGVSVSPVINPEIPVSFSVHLTLNGSSELLFSPIGEQTRVSLASGWPNPAFTGNFLPERREVHSSGFKAEWNVLHLNRNFPQQWLGSSHEISNFSFGVSLLLPVNEYQKTMRTAKYAIMFIGLTFLTFFMFEIYSKQAIHPVQYLLIGFALLVFYTLLLSASEYVAFNLSYLLSSAAVILLITLYSYSVLSSIRNSAILFGVLVLLYSYLYILLQLQDYALFMGSIALFSVLATVMFLTRNVNWFNVMQTEDDTEMGYSAGR